MQDAGAIKAGTAPYPPSAVIKSAAWHTDTYAWGADGCDRWPVTWGPDDNIYTAWGDGNGFSGQNYVSWGVAALSGAPNANGTDIYYNPDGFGKVIGLLFMEDILYALYDTDERTGVHNSNIALRWSADYGQRWTQAPWLWIGINTTLRPQGFVNFGKNYSGARDYYVYVVMEKAEDMKHAWMSRVPKTHMQEQSAYEYFAGMEGSNPIWNASMPAAQPIFTDDNASFANASLNIFPMIVYNPSLNLYLLTISHQNGNGLGIFDSPNPWGPWTTILYEDNWLGLTSACYGFLGAGFPVKWMSSDGLTMWSVFSLYDLDKAGNCGPYHDRFNLMKVTLEAAPAVQRWQNTGNEKRFGVLADRKAELKVCDLNGRIVCTLKDAAVDEAVRHTAGLQGWNLKAGVYLVTVTRELKSITRRVMLVGAQQNSPLFAQIISLPLREKNLIKNGQIDTAFYAMLPFNVKFKGLDAANQCSRA